MALQRLLPLAAVELSGEGGSSFLPPPPSQLGDPPPPNVVIPFYVSERKASLLHMCGFRVEGSSGEGESQAADRGGGGAEATAQAGRFKTYVGSPSVRCAEANGSEALEVDLQQLFHGCPPAKLRLKVAAFLVPFSSFSVPSVMQALAGRSLPPPASEEGTQPRDALLFAKGDADVLNGAAAEPDDDGAANAVGRDDDAAFTSSALSPSRLTSVLSPATGDQRRLLSLWGDRGVPPTMLNLDGYDGVLAVEPTGWAAKGSPSSTVRSLAHVSIVRVPYSEHCSFNELLDFVSFVQPRHIVATVSADAFARHETAFVERCARLKSRHSNVQPLSNFRHFFRRAADATALVACSLANTVAETLRGESARTPTASIPTRHVSSTHEGGRSAAASTGIITALTDDDDDEDDCVVVVAAARPHRSGTEASSRAAIVATSVNVTVAAGRKRNRTPSGHTVAAPTATAIEIISDDDE